MPFRRELAVYFAVALLGVLPALLRPTAMVGDGVDAFGTWWFYGWISDCVAHGMDPSFTTRFFFPLGKQIFTHTGNNFVDAVLGIPFWLAGTRGFALFVVVILVGNALCFRPFAKLVLNDEQRVFAATLLWLVNPYVLFEITAGRPTQAFLWFVPAVPYFLLKCARESGWANAVKLAISAALVGWTYWFACFFEVALCVPLIWSELRRSPQPIVVLQRWTMALVVVVLLVAPAAIPMANAWAAGETPGGVPIQQSIFELPGTVANSVGQRLHGLLLMESYGAPLFSNLAWGIPLAFALGMHVLGQGISRVWWVALVLVGVCAVGPVFNNEGEPLVNVAYMVLFKYLPFFNRLWFPYRFASVGFLIAALAIASVLPRKRAVVLALGLAALGLAEQARNAIFPFAWHDVGAPKLVQTISTLGGSAIFLPWGIQHDGIAWVATARLRLFGGMGESAPALWPKEFKRRLSHPVARGLRAATAHRKQMVGVQSGDVTIWANTDGHPRWLMLRRDLQSEQYAINNEVPTPSLAVARLTEVTGIEPMAVEGALVVWDLSGQLQGPEFHVSPSDLARDDWAPPSQPVWSMALQRHGRFGRAEK